MAITPLKVLLFLAGMVVFGVGTAYFAGAFDPAAREDGEMAAALDAGDADAGASSSQRGDRASTGTEAPEEAEKDAAAPKLERVVVPSFDVLRVEPDGSVVVAGRAAPGAEVEVLSGSTLLATTEAGPSGDFAAVLDQALTPGEHNIVLRATTSDKVAATSAETAIVSIPSAGNGEVVALVQQPGQPSRLITAPDADAPAGDAPPEAAQGAEAEGEPAQAQAPSEEQAAALGGGEDAGEAEETTERLADATGDRSGEEAPAEERADPASEAPTAEAPTAEAKTDEGTGTSAPAQEGQDAPARAAEAEASAQAAEAGRSGQEEPAAADASAFIEAVEIDGRQVFVAGRAEPGRNVRVYANDVLLGQATVNPDGSFLVETERDLPVGDYIVRADVLGDDGASVIARAAVPFQREEGEKIAAVAPDPARRARPDAEAEMPDTGTADDTSDSPAAADGDRRPAEAGEGGEDAAQGTGETAGMAPPLEPVDGAVIIRRGDTLWHISRRVYGHGIRYTTIYLANQDQIRDPDRIWPGQIFALPERTEQGEEADLGAIGDQAVSPEERAPDEEG
ncbi:LysM peptidoglycan-binding domain-containing protein [Chelativorans xinjiangense]|uniref:LysM peptidoglycan-binding domain-containing protein n=1 Tax=Chelativorans xinjiangense TaxID=2681485 RepID=UPI00135C278C|nr:Ig-like domain-containing protein [Chelativorans xinjiangense]